MWWYLLGGPDVWDAKLLVLCNFNVQGTYSLSLPAAIERCYPSSCPIEAENEYIKFEKRREKSRSFFAIVAIAERSILLVWSGPSQLFIIFSGCKEQAGEKFGSGGHLYSFKFSFHWKMVCALCRSWVAQQPSLDLQGDFHFEDVLVLNSLSIGYGTGLSPKGTMKTTMCLWWWK